MLKKKAKIDASKGGSPSTSRHEGASSSASESKEPKPRKKRVPKPPKTFEANKELASNELQTVEKGGMNNNSDQTPGRETMEPGKGDQPKDPHQVGSSRKGLNIIRNKGMKSDHWSIEETEKFMLALRMLGTDFFGMGIVFPNRNKAELKNKFKDEEERNPNLLEMVMSSKVEHLDLEELKREVGTNETSLRKKNTTANTKQKPEMREVNKNVIVPSTTGTPSGESFPESAQEKSSIATLMAPKGERKVFPRICNIIATVDLDCKIDLKTIVRAYYNCEFDPEFPSCVTMRLYNPITAIKIFACGKIGLSGAKSIEDARLGTRKCARLLQKCGFEVKYLNFTVDNIVANADVKFLIDLNAILKNCSTFCKYEPEKFPGLIFKVTKPKVSLIIFVSGKINFLGAKNQQDIDDALGYIFPIVEKYKKQ